MGRINPPFSHYFYLFSPMVPITRGIILFQAATSAPSVFSTIDNHSRIIMKKYLFPLFLALCSCGGDDKDEDMTKPTITNPAEGVCPADCQQFKRGDEMAVSFLLADNVELGNYNIEIHNNFDHHTHSTSSVECEQEADKKPVHPWIYNEDFAIPAGSTSYTAHQFIQIPTDIDPGDYHFMLRVTDKAGWQELRAVAIRITE